MVFQYALALLSWHHSHDVFDILILSLWWWIGATLELHIFFHNSNEYELSCGSHFSYILGAWVFVVVQAACKFFIVYLANRKKSMTFLLWVVLLIILVDCIKLVPANSCTWNIATPIMMCYILSVMFLVDIYLEVSDWIKVKRSVLTFMACSLVANIFWYDNFQGVAWLINRVQFW